MEKINNKRRKTKETGLDEWINRVMTYQEGEEEHNKQCSQQINKTKRKQKQTKNKTIAQSLVWRGFHSGGGWRRFCGELGYYPASSLAGAD